MMSAVKPVGRTHYFPVLWSR